MLSYMQEDETAHLANDTGHVLHRLSQSCTLTSLRNNSVQFILFTFLGHNMLSFVSSNGSVKISSPVGLKITRIITTCRNDALYIKLNIGDSGTRKIILVK